MTEYVAQLHAAAMPGAVNEALRLPIEYRDDALNLIFGRWSELDPAAATKYVPLLPKTRELGTLRRAAVAAWADRDPAAAIEWAKSAESNDARDEAMSAAIGAIARRDPAAALEAATASGRQSVALVGEVFKVWAESDLTAALAAARALSSPAIRTNALQGALRRQIDIEPGRALAAVQELNLGNQAMELVWPAFERWLERDGEGARTFLAGLPPGPLRENSLFVVATAMGRSQPLEALAWATGLPEGQDRRTAMLRLFEVWPSKDATGALTAAKGLADPGIRSAVYMARIDRTADEDLPLAMSIVSELPGEDQRKAAYSRLVGKWARTDPKGAAEWVVKGGPEVDLSSLKSAVSAWVQADAQSARTWIAALPPGPARSEATSVLIGQLSQSDPATAAAELEGISVDAQQKAALPVARSFAAKAPDEAARWAAGVRDPQAQAIALAEVARSWAQKNPTDAAAWLDGLAPGTGKDAAISTFSRTVLRRDPEGSLSWASTISTPGTRDQLVCNLVAEWLAFDRKSSAAWLQNAPLDSQLRDRIQVIDDYLQSSRR